FFFFFQAEDGIRDLIVTGVQTCALPICSFYLSIRLLPKKLRDPVSLGYLLARASDTIADTTELPIELRTEKLRLLARGIQGKALGDAIVDLSASLAPLQKNKAERALIEAPQPRLDWLEQSAVLDREDVRAVLE